MNKKEAFRKIAKIEQRIADELLALSIQNIKKENEYIQTFRREIRNFLGMLQNFAMKRPPKDKKEAQEAAKNVATWWSEELREQTGKIKAYFLDNMGFSENVNEILSRFRDEVRGVVGQGIQEDIRADAARLAGSDMFSVDQKQIEKFLDRRWAPDGKLFTERIEAMAGKEAATKFDRIFRDGFDRGLGYDQIVRNARKEIALDAVKLERIVRTEGQRIQNDILMASYYKNKGFIEGIEYTSTLDVMTCQECGSYDRQQFFFESFPGGKVAIDAPYIPVHPGCRCTYAPISIEWEKAFGTGTPEVRASMFGPTKDYNYSSWLGRMETEKPGFAKDVLKGHYEDWMAGGYTLEAFRFTPQSTISDYLAQTEVEVVKKPKKGNRGESN